RQSGSADHGRQEGNSGLRRLGARLLPEISEPPSGLYRRVVEHGELARGGFTDGQVASEQESKEQKSGEQGAGRSRSLLLALCSNQSRIPILNVPVLNPVPVPDAPWRGRDAGAGVGGEGRGRQVLPLQCRDGGAADRR